MEDGTDKLPDAAGDLCDIFGTEIGGKPGRHSWEAITALFGWIAAFSLLGYLISHIAGFSSLATWAFAIFSACIGVALKRDLIKVLVTARLGGSNG